jgi:hypothetical protein
MSKKKDLYYQNDQERSADDGPFRGCFCLFMVVSFVFMFGVMVWILLSLAGVL